MNGKIPALVLILSAGAAGLGVWYTQTRAYYTVTESPDGAGAGVTVALRDGRVVPLEVTNYRQIDATSAPHRWRACFDVAEMPAGAMPFDDAPVLNGPGWFGCFNAAQLAEDLAAGRAHAYLSAAEIRPDVDRVIAVYPDGHAVGWHILNDKTPERGVMD